MINLTFKEWPKSNALMSLYWWTFAFGNQSLTATWTVGWISRHRCTCSPTEPTLTRSAKSSPATGWVRRYIKYYSTFKWYFKTATASSNGNGIAQESLVERKKISTNRDNDTGNQCCFCLLTSPSLNDECVSRHRKGLFRFGNQRFAFYMIRGILVEGKFNPSHFTVP